MSNFFAFIVGILVGATVAISTFALEGTLDAPLFISQLETPRITKMECRASADLNTIQFLVEKEDSTRQWLDTHVKCEKKGLTTHNVPIR